ncbi:pilus assembly protein TadG-related protein [Methylosinus sp. Sm6]|uniref:pilus assembly protein TadG-related protein n=1 Tax=Methylosinus sp. Sm6 TaxID=2866948 RepID=UPI001C99C34A|nr:pilus assembly protein TadG-related protein [Methylosinus sp. Sm6]MBY6239920.1 pilus assembly protein [Methylosinus sp. Sm6]
MTFSVLSRLSSLVHDRRGNTAIIFALGATPLFVAAGVAIDYGFAAKIKTQLAAIADAAALSATTPAMMKQSEADAETAATNMFAAQANLIKGFAYDGRNLTIDVADSAEVNKMRTVTVSYSGRVANSFGGLYYSRYTNVAVSSAASRSNAPNIDFYLLLDNSPSMELPATTAGIDSMVQATGCAFACHETNFKDPELKTYSGWGSKDSYAYAKDNGITLRIDNVRAAAQSLATTAQSVMATNGAAYRLAAYSFDYKYAELQKITKITNGTVKIISKNIGQLTPPLMSDNNNLAGDQYYTYPTGPSSYVTTNRVLSGSLYNNDAMTDFNMALTKMNSDLPDPGNGGSTGGDKPQEVLMLVTDGVDDASHYLSGQCSTRFNWSYSNSFGSFYRCQQPIDVSLCSTIKSRGIRIAVLYTTYFPVTSNGWYRDTVAPFISQVPTNLQSCASSPQLYFEVNTNGDITEAMTTLFKNAVSTAPHLTQ